MKRYIFQITEAFFKAPNEIEYSEIEHKVLNEDVKGIEISVLAENIEVAQVKAGENLNELILLQLSDYPKIKFYKFGLKIIKIEEN